MKTKWIIIAGLALVLLPALAAGATGAGAAVATLSYLGMSNLPKGMRNNNPGNIRRSSNPWQGKIPFSQSTDGAFEQFETYVYGIRAMIKNLLSYGDRGLNTLRKIISTWAPAADNNDTSAYINFVSQRTGFAPDQVINLDNVETMRRVLIAMTEMENGRPAVTDDQFFYAYSIV